LPDHRSSLLAREARFGDKLDFPVEDLPGRKDVLEMTSRSSWLVPLFVIVFSVTSFSNLHALAGHNQTFTGEVGDAMCGRNHMEGTPAECTRTCVSHGSKFALVVGEKIYILETSDKTALAVLDQQAGKNATVTGVLNGDTIEVNSVAAK
jgi:hypothetical protein